MRPRCMPLRKGTAWIRGGTRATAGTGKWRCAPGPELGIARGMRRKHAGKGIEGRNGLGPRWTLRAGAGSAIMPEMG